VARSDDSASTRSRLARWLGLSVAVLLWFWTLVTLQIGFGYTQSWNTAYSIAAILSVPFALVILLTRRRRALQRD